MTPSPTAADFQRLIDELDAHMVELRALLEQGAAIRETLVKGMAAAAMAERSDGIVVSIDWGRH